MSTKAPKFFRLILESSLHLFFNRVFVSSFRPWPLFTLFKNELGMWFGVFCSKIYGYMIWGFLFMKIRYVIWVLSSGICSTYASMVSSRSMVQGQKMRSLNEFSQFLTHGIEDSIDQTVEQPINHPNFVALSTSIPQDWRRDQPPIQSFTEPLLNFTGERQFSLFIYTYVM